MSWLMKVAKDIFFGIFFSLTLVTANILASLLIVLVSFTIVADMDLLFVVPTIPPEAQVTSLNLLGMNALIILTAVVSWFAYKLTTLFNNLDFSFDSL